ncbi:hypothetical protein [Curtobacterium sp. MCPF17_046]|uniref:hypothetical protein n=1 Tax=Curtobacterium sp. MCPF17_046 TaxID=2175663 RepID=UPI0015E8BB4D|nr:hypothetical protein [Curtobacterium sp. MCPF17_046]
MNTSPAVEHNPRPSTAARRAELIAAVLHPITVRDATVTKVRPEIRDGVVTRTIGEIQIYPESRRIEIVLGIGVMDHERRAAAANAVILPQQLLRDDPALWNEIRKRGTGERMLRVALWLPAPDPLVHLELEQTITIDTRSEVTV